MANLKEQIERKGSNPEPAPRKVLPNEPKKQIIPDRKPLKPNQQRLND